MKLEQLVKNYYDESLKKLMPSEYLKQEHDFAYRLFKSISYDIWSDKIMTNEQKIEYFDGYNKENIVEMLTQSIEVIKTYDIKKSITFRDLTSVPKEWIFYNQKIKHTIENDEMLTLFKTINIFSSGKLKVGFQSGVKMENGDNYLESFDESIYEYDKCYVMLSFKETTNLSNHSTEEFVFLDYYLGNDTFE